MNYVVDREGEVLPSYTGENAPIMPGGKYPRVLAEDMPHPEFMDLSVDSPDSATVDGVESVQAQPVEYRHSVHPRHRVPQRFIDQGFAGLALTRRAMGDVSVVEESGN